MIPLWNQIVLAPVGIAVGILIFASTGRFFR